MIIMDLKRILKRERMSLTELSEKTGISRTSLSQLANGRTQGIQFDTLEKISVALNVRPGLFFRMEKEPLEAIFDFSAITEYYPDTISIYLIFKSELKNNTAWHSCVIHFIFKEKDYIDCSFNDVNIEITRDLVCRKYGLSQKEWDRNNSEIDHELSKSENIKLEFNDILKKRGLQYFTENVDLINEGLKYIDAKKNMKYIKISKKLHVNMFSEEELEILNPNNKYSIDSMNVIYVEYFYELILEGNQYKISKDKQPKIEVHTDIYKDYTDKISIL